MKVPMPPPITPEIPFQRKFETERTVSDPWITTMCYGCKRIRLTNLSLMQLMFNLHAVCYKCKDKVSKQQLRERFILQREIEGEQLAERVRAS